jgi:hypothetical protein
MSGAGTGRWAGEAARSSQQSGGILFTTFER